MYCKLKKYFSCLNEENFILKNNNLVLQSKSSKFEKENLSKASTNYDNVINKYGKSFQNFFARSVMASMIYGASRKGTRGISYDSDEESTSDKDDKPKTLNYHFVPYGKKMVLCLKVKPFQNLRLKQKHIPISTMHICMIILHRNPSLSKTLGRLTKKDPESYGYLRIR